MDNLQPHHLAEHANQIGEAMAAFIEVQGMIAENEQRKHRGESLAYTENEFLKVAERYGMEYNSLIDKKRRFF